MKKQWISIFFTIFLDHSSFGIGVQSPFATLTCTLKTGKNSQIKVVKFETKKLATLAPGAHPLSDYEPKLKMPMPIAFVYSGNENAGELELTFNQTQVSSLELIKGFSGSSKTQGKNEQGQTYSCGYEVKN